MDFPGGPLKAYFCPPILKLLEGTELSGVGASNPKQHTDLDCQEEASILTTLKLHEQERGAITENYRTITFR